MAMSLTNEDLQQVGTYVRAHLSEWLPWNVLDLSERIVRVEEELKSQGRRMDERFEAVDRRFEDLQSSMDKRFTDLQSTMDRRFEAIDERFEAIDERFEDMHKHTNRWMTIVSLALVMLGALMTWFNVAG